VSAGEPIDPDQLEAADLPTSFRGLEPHAVQQRLHEAAEELRAARERIAELEEQLAAQPRSETEQEIEQAKREGRELVLEAQVVRRRILEDLIRRRRSLRRQIEQLRAGRERLLEAYELIGHTVEEATQELGAALPEARAAAERAGRHVEPEETVEALEGEIEAARLAGLPIVEMPEDEVVEAPPEPVAPDAPPPGEPEVLALFDRIRTESAEPLPPILATPRVAEGPSASPEPEPEPEPEEDREPEPEEQPEEEEPEDDRVEVLADDLARHLKRELADEQNQVLDRLRQGGAGLTLDVLLGDAQARVARLAAAIQGRIQAAVDESGSDAVTADLAHRLAAEVVDGVHAEIAARCTDLGEDDTEGMAREVRAGYREWRTDRIAPLALTVAGEAVV
jgi:hypothetical protein